MAKMAIPRTHTGLRKYKSDSKVIQVTASSGLAAKTYSIAVGGGRNDEARKSHYASASLSSGGLFLTGSPSRGDLSGIIIDKTVFLCKNPINRGQSSAKSPTKSL